MRMAGDFAVPGSIDLLTLELRSGTLGLQFMLIRPDTPDSCYQAGRTGPEGIARLAIERPAPGSWELVLIDRLADLFEAGMPAARPAADMVVDVALPPRPASSLAAPPWSHSRSRMSPRAILRPASALDH